MDAKTKRITALMQWVSASPPGVLRAAFERELLQLVGVAPPAAPCDNSVACDGAVAAMLE